MANQFETRRLTPRKRAYLEEQRLRNVVGAFEAVGQFAWLRHQLVSA